MRSTWIFITGAILYISSILLFVQLPLANATQEGTSRSRNSKIISPNKNTNNLKTRKVGDDRFKKLLEETARYAINFIPAEGNSSNPGTMATTAVVDMMSQIRDPFKHGVTSAVLAGLYIVALISLIVFATTGTVAFICSFSDCRHFFMGMKGDGGSPRPYPGGGPFFFKRRDNSQYRWEDMQLQPVVQSLHDSYDKYEHKE